MAIKLNLSAQEIYEKVFEPVSRGYDPLKVDEFLDKIIRDYQMVEENSLVSKNETDKLRSKIQRLESEKRELEVELQRYKTKLANIKTTDNVSTDNIKYVKRINALEKFIWNHGFNPNNIK